MQKILFSMLLLTVVVTLSAQAPNWLNYTCGKEVNCLAEEGNFIWAGTNGGLVKLNRITSEKTHFNPANSGLKGIGINDIGIDSQGNKWIATQFGLNKLSSDGTWSLTLPNYTGPRFNITCLDVDNQDNVWVIGDFTGIFKYNSVTGWFNYDMSFIYPSFNSIRYLEIDYQSNIWAAGSNVLFKYNGSQWTEYANLVNYCEGSYFDVTEIASDHLGNVWLGSYFNGLLKFNGTGWTFFDISNSVIYYDYTNALYCDNANNLWLGTYHGRLVKYDGTNWTVYSDYPNAIFPGRVYAILVDAQNHVWTGTEHLYEYNGTDWAVHDTANSPLPEIRQYKVHADSQDRIWLGGDNGLTKISNSVWTNYNNTNSGFPQERAFAFDSDSNGKLWCLARDTAYALDVVSFDGTNWTVYNSSNSILTGDTFCLAVDNLNRLWLGSSHGTVFRYDGTAWTELTVPITVPWNNDISYIGADSQNNIYAYGYWGLARYNGTDWTVWQYDTIPVPIGNLLDFYLDPQDNVWIGSKAGLAQFNGTTWNYYDPSNSGMPHWYALAMCRDNLGNLWFRSCDEDTDGCLVKFDGTTWTSFYSYDYPLTDSEINDIACDSYNNLWMATDNGITVYNENGIVANQDDVLPTVTSNRFRLRVYPNPFGANANISFDMAKNEHVSLCIYDVKGRLVKRLHNAYTQKGSHSSVWDGIDKTGKPAANGIYFCRIETSSGSQMKKLVLIK